LKEHADLDSSKNKVQIDHDENVGKIGAEQEFGWSVDCPEMHAYWAAKVYNLKGCSPATRPNHTINFYGFVKKKLLWLSSFQFGHQICLQGSRKKVGTSDLLTPSSQFTSLPRISRSSV
jgi:hypothetical protein